MRKKTEIDLERVVSDPAYRRRVIKQLNAEARVRPQAEDTASEPASRPAKTEAE